MDPLLAWFATQALGPHLVGRAWDHFTDRDFRSRLAQEATEVIPEKTSRRRIEQWLSRKSTWEDLVDPSEAGVARLVLSLTQDLKPRVVIRTRRHTRQRRRATARLVVGEVATRFIQSLDPSVATAVAHYREMRALSELAEQTGEILRLNELRVDKDARLAKLPPNVRPRVDDLIQLNERGGLHLLDALTEGAVAPGRAVVELTRSPPAWLEQLSPTAWVALAEFAAAYDEHETASMLYEQAADLAAQNRPRQLALAAGEAFNHGDEGRCDELLQRAQDLTHGAHPFLAARLAARSDDPEGVIDAVNEGDLDDDLLLLMMVAQAHAWIGEHDRAIALLIRAAEDSPEIATVRVLAAEHLAERAGQGSGAAKASDLETARRMVIEARDLCRGWSGDSVKPVRLACVISGMLHDMDAVLRLGQEDPEGEATPEEAADNHVLGLVALAAMTVGDMERAEAAAERITDPYLRTASEADMHAKTGNRQAAVDAYEQAWELATTEAHQQNVQLGLADLAIWPLPDHEALERRDAGEAAWILARGEIAQGNLDAATRRLRPWQTRHLPCANLLAAIHLESGDVDGAVETFKGAARVHETVEPLVASVQTLAQSGRFAEAEQLAREALAEASRPDHRRALLEVMAASAQERHDWAAMERHARTMIDRAPSDQSARWLLVGALYNQRRLEEAWNQLTRDEPLDAQTEPQAVAWMDLHRRFAPSLGTWESILDIQERFASSEEVHAAAITAVLLMDVREEPPQALVERWQHARDDFFVQYPDSNRIWQMEVGRTADEIVEALGPMLKARAETLEKIRQSVLQARMPLGMLAMAAGRSYGVALATTAAGAHVINLADGSIFEIERDAAASALDKSVVVDASIFNVLSYQKDLLPRVRTAFRSLQAIDDSIADMRACVEELESPSDGSISWDLDHGSLRVSDDDEDATAEARGRASWMLEALTFCMPASHSAVTELPMDDDDPRYRPWLGPLDYAKKHDLPLYSDDAALRMLARSEGVPAFGTLALLAALDDIGEPVADLPERLLEWRRHGFVDLPSNGDDLRLLAQEASWKPPNAALLALSRPAFWQHGPNGLELYKDFVSHALAEAPDSLGTWLYAAILGAGDGQNDLTAAIRAIQLLLHATAITNADPEHFTELAASAKAGAIKLGIDDPTIPALDWFFAQIREEEDAGRAAEFILRLASETEEGLRDHARHLAFGVDEHS